MDWADYLRDEAAKYRQLAETAEGLSVNGDDRRAPFASALINSTQFKRWQPIRGAARGCRGRNRSGPRELNEDQIDGVGAGDRDDENPAGSARGVGRRTGQEAKIRAKREAAMAKSEAEWASLVADLTAELRATRADLARLRQLKAVSPGPEPMGDVIGQRAEDANRKPAP